MYTKTPNGIKKGDSPHLESKMEMKMEAPIKENYNNVKKPIYLTWWFYLIILLIIGIGLAIWYRKSD